MQYIEKNLYLQIYYSLVYLHMYTAFPSIYSVHSILPATIKYNNSMFVEWVLGTNRQANNVTFNLSKNLIILGFTDE